MKGGSEGEGGLGNNLNANAYVNLDCRRRKMNFPNRCWTIGPCTKPISGVWDLLIQNRYRSAY